MKYVIGWNCTYPGELKAVWLCKVSGCYFDWDVSNAFEFGSEYAAYRHIMIMMRTLPVARDFFVARVKVKPVA